MFFPSRLEVEDALLLQQLEGRLPEMQVQDLALARQEVIFDVEPVHGLQMPAQHRGRDQVRDLGHLVAALLDGMQRFKSQLSDCSLSCSYHCETRA